MLRSNIYHMLKRIIEKGNYDAEDILNKLDTYYLVGRLTDDQYLELMFMVSEQSKPPIPDIDPEN